MVALVIGGIGRGRSTAIDVAAMLWEQYCLFGILACCRLKLWGGVLVVGMDVLPGGAGRCSLCLQAYGWEGGQSVLHFASFFFPVLSAPPFPPTPHESHAQPHCGMLAMLAVAGLEVCWHVPCHGKCQDTSVMCGSPGIFKKLTCG